MTSPQLVRSPKFSLDRNKHRLTVYNTHTGTQEEHAREIRLSLAKLLPGVKPCFSAPPSSRERSNSDEADKGARLKQSLAKLLKKPPSAPATLRKGSRLRRNTISENTFRKKRNSLEITPRSLVINKHHYLVTHFPRVHSEALLALLEQFEDNLADVEMYLQSRGWQSAVRRPSVECRHGKTTWKDV